MIEQTTEQRQRLDDTESDDEEYPKPETIGELLKLLRGDRTLRQVETDTGISNSYLSNLEMGRKNPGIRSLSKLAAYYDVPLNGLLDQAGLPYDHRAAKRHEVLTNPRGNHDEIQRSYEFVLTDPQLALYEKPTETPSVDTQKFVVKLYEHYTGKRLL